MRSISFAAAHNLKEKTSLSLGSLQAHRRVRGLGSLGHRTEKLMIDEAKLHDFIGKVLGDLGLAN